MTTSSTSADPVVDVRSDRPARRWYGVVLLSLFAMTAALRFAHLGRESLWFDEGYSWWMASLSPSQLVHVLRADVSSPLYYLLLGQWMHHLGDDAIGMRSLSALCGTLAFVPFLLLARQSLRSTAAVLTACALFAGNTLQVMYAQEARCYAMQSLWMAIAYACVPSLARRPRWWTFALVTSAAIASLYTHPMAPFTLSGLAVAWLVWPGERPFTRRVKDGASVLAVALAAYLPWLPITLEQVRWTQGNFWIATPGGDDFAQVVATLAGTEMYAVSNGVMTTTGSFWPATTIAKVVAAVVVLSALLAVVLAPDRDGRQRAIALIAIAFVPVALAFVYSLVRQPIFATRAFVSGGAVVPILLAAAIDPGRGISARLVGAVCVALIAIGGAISLASFYAKLDKEDWRGAYSTVASMPASRDRLLVFVANEGELAFMHYVSQDRDRPREPRTGAPAGFFDADPPRPLMAVRSDADLALLNQRLAAHAWREVVLIECHEATADPEGRVRAYLSKQFEQVELHELRKIRVTRFRSPA